MVLVEVSRTKAGKKKVSKKAECEKKEMVLKKIIQKRTVVSFPYPRPRSHTPLLSE